MYWDKYSKCFVTANCVLGDFLLNTLYSNDLTIFMRAKLLISSDIL